MCLVTLCTPKFIGLGAEIPAARALCTEHHSRWLGSKERDRETYFLQRTQPGPAANAFRDFVNRQTAELRFEIWMSQQ